MGWEEVDGVYLPVDRDKRRTVVNTVMNIRVSQNNRNFFSNRGYKQCYKILSVVFR